MNSSVEVVAFYRWEGVGWVWEEARAWLDKHAKREDKLV